MAKKRLSRYERLLLPDLPAPSDQPIAREHGFYNGESLYVVVRRYRPPVLDPFHHTQLGPWPTLSVGDVLYGMVRGEVTRYRLRDGTIFSVFDRYVDYRRGKLYAASGFTGCVCQLEHPKAHLPRWGVAAAPVDHFVPLFDPKRPENSGHGFRLIPSDVVRPYELARDRPSAWERLARDIGDDE